MKKVVAFDLGWTLEDESAAQTDRALQVAGVCRRHGISLEPDLVLELQREAGRQGIASVYSHALGQLGLPAEVLAKIKRTVVWNTAGLRLYPGAGDVLVRLARSHDLALIANQSRPVAGRLAAYGIGHLFKVIICSCEVGLEKPDPAIFALLEQAYAGQEIEFWMIGDRLDNDIRPAKARGWKTIHIRQGDHCRYEARDPAEQPDHRLDSLAGLESLF